MLTHHSLLVTYYLLLVTRQCFRVMYLKMTADFVKLFTFRAIP